MGLLIPHLGIIDHLDHEHAAVFVETDFNWISHQRLRRHQFESKARFNLEGRQLVAGIDGRKPRQVFQVDLGLCGDAPHRCRRQHQEPTRLARKEEK